MSLTTDRYFGNVKGPIISFDTKFDFLIDNWGNYNQGSQVTHCITTNFYLQKIVKARKEYSHNQSTFV